MSKKNTNPQWFKNAKYGLFIHWGLYSILAGEYKGQKTDRIAEWIMNDFNIPVEDYEKLAAEFNPVNFDADFVVKKAKEWGMRYIVFTSKHHDGFAMFHSKCNPYNIVDSTPFKGDILRELKNACDKYDMPLGLYYSQAQDWHDPDGFMYRKENDHKDYQSYLDRKCLPQLRELLTEYGNIALIWFDTPMGTTLEQSQSMIDLVKSLQPDCLVSGRIGNHMGDYMTTGDNFIPLLPFDGDWELPATLNGTWGYNKYDHHWKTPEEVIRLLLKISSRGGNYLLNIGPDALGNVPEGSIEVLDQVGRYVQENAEGIYDTVPIGIYPYELEWAQMTRKPHRLYIHILQPKVRIDLINIGNRIKRAYLLKDGSELPFEAAKTCEGDSLIEVELPKSLQDRTHYCVCLETEEEAPIFEPITS